MKTYKKFGPFFYCFDIENETSVVVREHEIMYVDFLYSGLYDPDMIDSNEKEFKREMNKTIKTLKLLV